MSAKVISSGQLYLFPTSPNARSCCSQPSRAAVLRKPRSPKNSCGALRARAMAAVCAPAAQTSQDSFYELLGIPESGSISEIKKAYKQLARKYHPDVSPSDRTEEYTKRFIEVQEAYETLSDPQTRALYDMDLARGLQLNFSTRRRRYERMEDVEEWQRRWQTQLDELKRRSMQKDSAGAGAGAGAGAARGKSTSWGTGTRRRRNNIFDLGFN